MMSEENEDMIEGGEWKSTTQVLLKNFEAARKKLKKVSNEDVYKIWDDSGGIISLQNTLPKPIVAAIRYLHHTSISVPRSTRQVRHPLPKQKRLSGPSRTSYSRRPSLGNAKRRRVAQWYCAILSSAPWCS